MPRRTALLVAVGGAVGAAARWALLVLLPTTSGFPWPIFVVNVLGSALLGWLVVAARTRPSHRPDVAELLGVGFCGGLTTFSTFALELATLGQDDRWGLAAVYGLASLAAGVTAAAMTGEFERRRAAT